MFFVILWYQRWTWDNLLLSLCVCVCVCALSHVRLFATTWIVACQLLCPWDFPGMNTEVGCHAILQGIFPTQGLNPWLLCLLHCRRILGCWAIGEAWERSVTKFTPKFISLRQICCSYAKLCPTLCNPMDCSSPGFPVLHYPRVCSNSCLLSRWCYPTISSNVALFSSCPKSFPA